MTTRYVTMIGSAEEFIDRGLGFDGIQSGKFYFLAYVENDPNAAYWSEPYDNEDEAEKGWQAVFKGQRQ